MGMAGLAKEVLPLVDEILAKEKLPKSKALFMRWKGDYSSHLAEVSKGDARTEWEDKSEAAYKEAMESAKGLSDTDDVKLGLLLHYAVFQHDIKEDGTKGCDMTRTAFHDGMEDMSGVSESDYKDVTKMMQKLHDNLVMWVVQKNEEVEVACRPRFNDKMGRLWMSST